MNSSASAVEVGGDDFDTVVLQASADVPVLVDFWADWCAPCRVLKLHPLSEPRPVAHHGMILAALPALVHAAQPRGGHEQGAVELGRKEVAQQHVLRERLGCIIRNPRSNRRRRSWATFHGASAGLFCVQTE